MGQKSCLSSGTSWQDHRIASKLGGYQDKVIPLELVILPNIFPLESQARREVFGLPSHQHQICASKQLSQQKCVHKLQCNSELSL